MALKGNGMGAGRVFLLFFSFVFFLNPEFAACTEKPLWEAGAGFGVLQMPDYRGSDKIRSYLLPYPYVVYRGEILKVEEQRVSGQIFKTDRVTLNFSGYGAVPVKSSDNAARAGMPDLDPTFELGPSLAVKIMDDRDRRYKLTMALPVRAFFSTDFASVRSEGWVFSPRINFEKKNMIPGTGLNLGVSVGPMFADSGYHAYFYAVRPAYATAERPAYAAGGGYSGSTVTVGLSRAYRQWIVNAFISADFLQGAVFADSPLVKTRTSVMGGVGVTWVFLRSHRYVTADP